MRSIHRPQSRDRLQNFDRKRWYGIRPGDQVTLRYPGGTVKELTVVCLHSMDNNGCTVKDNTGREFKAVCEWLEIRKAAE